MVSAELAVVTELLSNRIHLTVVTDDFLGSSEGPNEEQDRLV